MTSFFENSPPFSQRSRFVSGDCTPSAQGGGTNTPISRNLETNNQTLPRTFRWNNTNNHATITPTLTPLIGAAAGGSQSQLPTSEKSTINRFLSGGSGTNTPISQSRNLVEINSSPMPWKSSSTNFCDSPYQQRRRLDNSVESAAKFLTEALPCTNNTGSCKKCIIGQKFQYL